MLMAKYPSNVSVSMDPELLQIIDDKRGDVPRSAFIRRLVLKGLGMEVSKKH